MEDSSFLTFQGHLDSALRLACAGISHTHPGHKFGPSVRSYYLIHYIFDGCGTFFTNGTSYHLHKGQGFLIRPGTQTTYQADETDPWSYVWIGFAGTLAAETVQNAGITPHEPIFHTDASDEIRNCITTLLDHSHTSAADHFYSLACFYRFMSYIALANKERPPRRSTMTASMPRSSTCRIILPSRLPCKNSRHMSDSTAITSRRGSAKPSDKRQGNTSRHSA